jgi:hypothetical protein
MAVCPIIVILATVISTVTWTVLVGRIGFIAAILGGIAGRRRHIWFSWAMYIFRVALVFTAFNRGIAWTEFVVTIVLVRTAMS